MLQGEDELGKTETWRGMERERTLRKDKANGEAEWQQQQTGWAEQDGIEKMYGAGAM